MSELEEKLGTILSNPQLMQQISAMAQALGQAPPEPPAPRDPEEDLRAAHAVLAAMEAIEAEERRARGGDG